MTFLISPQFQFVISLLQLKIKFYIWHFDNLCIHVFFIKKRVYKKAINMPLCVSAC